MIRRNRRKPKAKGTLPAFTPVPRHYNRHDGWTPERQTRFIEHLADLGSVRAAANAVGMTPEGAYYLRRHPQAGSFRSAWEAALALGVQRLEDIAMDRAMHGVEVPIYCYGKVIGTRTVYNDALLMFLLRNRAPGRFAADSIANADAATRSHISRLKREWRAEWEAEQSARAESDSEATLASLNNKLDRMREREEAAAHSGLSATNESNETTTSIRNPTPDQMPKLPRRRPPLPAPYDFPRNDDEAVIAQWLAQIEDRKFAGEQAVKDDDG